MTPHAPASAHISACSLYTAIWDMAFSGGREVDNSPAGDVSLLLLCLLFCLRASLSQQQPGSTLQLTISLYGPGSISGTCRMAPGLRFSCLRKKKLQLAPEIRPLSARSYQLSYLLYLMVFRLSPTWMPACVLPSQKTSAPSCG